MKNTSTEVNHQQPAMLFFFVKFTAKESYARDFLSGRLYANTVRYFRELESKGQGDRHEGLVGWFQPTRGRLTIEGRDITPDLAGPIGFSRNDILSHHLFCLYCGHTASISPDASDEEVKARMQLSVQSEDFGEYAVLVRNVKEFLDRVQRALDKEGFEWRRGLVGYYDPNTFHGPFTEEEAVFRKRLEYGHQREYRFAIDTGNTGNSPLSVEVGDLSDIAELYQFSQLDDVMGRIEVHSRRLGE